MEDILHSTAKLHMHNWILMSRNEEYDNCGLGFLCLFYLKLFLSFFLSFFLSLKLGVEICINS